MEPIAHGTPRTDDHCCWPGCFHPPTDLPLCEQHRRQIGYTWVADNIDLVRAVCSNITSDEVLFDQVRRGVQARVPDRTAQREAERLAKQAGAVVYYVQIRDRVKIGYTTELAKRIATFRLLPEHVLATEPGGRDVEQGRHRQFAEERFGRSEEFAMSDRLIAHIESLSECGATGAT